MTSKQSIRIAVVAAGAFVAILGSSSTASAQAKRIHNSGCQHNMPLNAGGQAYNNSVANQGAICPITTWAPNTFVSVDGWQNGSEKLQARACVTFTGGGGTGGICDPFTKDSGGAKVVHLPVLANTLFTTFPLDYKYVEVLVGTSVPGFCTFFGLTHS
jgi:hypothetical protein